MMNYIDKFTSAIKNSYFDQLNQKNQDFIRSLAFDKKLSLQEIREYITMARDLELWDEGDLELIFLPHQNKKISLKKTKQNYETIRNKPNRYDNFTLHVNSQEQKYHFKTTKKEGFGLGLCPVASEKTRCCNLLTLDAVESCGFDCSYCSIQSFYNQNTITFDSDFANKLANLQLDPHKTYHIGTGQSSDSLMFGNREGILDALFAFALRYPNVILEFKTKSNNITYLLENDVPKNIICTWSLNTPTIINNEEHLTASLEKRIDAARKVADKGVKVGFHFHPIVEYENYLDEYEAVYETLLHTFSPSEVALVSFGTLTFIKPVIKQLRNRDFKTKITQMPFDEIAGKHSYPLQTKVEMFSHAYKSFAPWHKEVFFYMCMEEHSLWEKCFGYHYATNNDFERDMLYNYTKKLGLEFYL
ncbi:MAG: hypothetical protein GXO11_07985 [Epsilonproteobacteria bacterium]|nr:hypothetical protein [Campylobacterota bacterium]